MKLSRSVMLAGAGLTVAGLTLQEYFARHWGGGPIGLNTMLFAQSIGAVVWIVLAASVIAPVSRRFAGLPMARRLPALVVIGVALALVHTAIVATVFASYYYGWSPLAIRDVFRDRMHTGFAWSVVISLLIAGVFDYRSRAQSDTAESSAPITEQPSPTLTEGPSATTDEEPSAPTRAYLRRILVKTDGRVGVVPVAKVDWIEAAGNNLIIHAGADKHTVRSTVTGLADRLDPANFVRVHRSVIVNVDRIRELQTWFQGELVLLLHDDTKLTIGRSYRDQVLTTLEG